MLVRFNIRRNFHSRLSVRVYNYGHLVSHTRISDSAQVVQIQLESENWVYKFTITPQALYSHNVPVLTQNHSHTFHMCKVYCTSMSRVRLFNLMTCCTAPHGLISAI